MSAGQSGFSTEGGITAQRRFVLWAEFADFSKFLALRKGFSDGHDDRAGGLCVPFD